MAVKFEWYDENKTLKRFTENDKVGKFLAETCERYMNPYVPMDTGMLAQNTLIEPFKVTYNQPYAHRQYTGDGFHFSRDMHPLATSRWDREMQAARKKDIAKETSDFIRSM